MPDDRSKSLISRWTALFFHSTSYVLIALVELVAFLLARTRTGLVLRAVSIPRMKQQRMRTSVTVLGVALGVAVLISVLIVNHSILRGVNATFDDVAGKADLQLSAGTAGFSEELLDRLHEVPGVYRITPSTQQVTTALGANGKRERILVLGVDLLGSEDRYFRTYTSEELPAIQREQLSFLNSTNNVILGRELAQRLGVGLHDKFQLAGGDGLQEFEVWGFVELQGVGRAFGGAVAMMYYPAMQVAFKRDRNIDVIDIAVEPGTDVDEVAKRIQDHVGLGFSVERPARRGTRVANMIQAVRTGLTMASLTALIAGAFLVFATATISIAQRKRELGLLRALGTTRAQLVSLLTLDGLLYGVVGSLVGIGLGVGISGGMLRLTSRVVNELYVQQGVTAVHVDTSLLMIGVLSGAVVSTVAARLAAQRISKLSPRDALSTARAPVFVASQRGISRTEWFGVGLVVISVALLFLPSVEQLPIGALLAMIGLAFAAQAFLPRLLRVARPLLRPLAGGDVGGAAALAVDGVYRDAGRTAANASGLVVGVALVVCMSTFATSFVRSMDTWSSQTVVGDLLVTSGAAIGGLSSQNHPLSESVGTALEGISGVQRVRRLRYVDLDYQGAIVKLFASDTRVLAERSLLTVLEGNADAVFQRLEQGEVAVSENFAQRFGVRAGDALQLTTRAGRSPFRVAAVVLDYTSDLGTVLLDRSTYVKHWGDERIDTFELQLAAGVEPEQVRARIDQTMGERFDLFVLTNHEFRAALTAAADQVFSLMQVLEVVSLVVALLGLLTTILAGVMDRFRELGVFRAIGMLRRQVVSLVVTEAILIGLLGTVGGTLLGFANGYVLLKHVVTAQSGWLIPYHAPATTLAIIFVLIPGLSALAAVLPARRAGSLKLREALGYE